MSGMADSAGTPSPPTSGVRVSSWSEEFFGISLTGHVPKVTISPRDTESPCHAFDGLVLRAVHAAKNGERKRRMPLTYMETHGSKKILVTHRLQKGGRKGVGP